MAGTLPYRLQMAGGWIDQPFLSAANPEPPGSMVVVSLLPTVRYMDRCGMATGTRAAAKALWGDTLPTGRTPESLVRELYAVENANRSEPSGSQDMCGLIYPGISRLDYDASIDGGWFPARVESTSDPEVVAWLERVLHLVPIGQRPPGYGPLGVKQLDPAWIARLGASGRACYDAILAMDIHALGASLNECTRAWAAILPQVYEHPTITIDLHGLVAAYAAEHPGAMLSGCGGGYVIVASEKAPAGSSRISIRTWATPRTRFSRGCRGQPRQPPLGRRPLPPGGGAHRAPPRPDPVRRAGRGDHGRAAGVPRGRAPVPRRVDPLGRDHRARGAPPAPRPRSARRPGGRWGRRSPCARRTTTPPLRLGRGRAVRPVSRS